jgi:sulfofructose kinase
MGITGANTPEAAILELYKKYEPEVIAVTDGANGGYYVSEGKVYHYDSFKITAVDTNGAGDTFHGAFIAAYLDGKSIAECCKFSSATSAYKCMRKDARDYALSKDIITEFITKNS